MSTVERKGRRKMPPAAVSHADEPFAAVSAIPAQPDSLPDESRLEATTPTPVVSEVKAPVSVDSEPQAPAPVAASPESIAEPVTRMAEEAVTAEKDITMDATTTTAQAAGQTADRAQAMFSDAAERTQGAMDRGQRFLSEMAELGKGNVEAMVESSRIAARGFESMGRDAAAYAKSSFEGATEAMRTMATVKSPTDFMRLQAEFARNAFDAMIAQTSKSTEASLKLAGEVAQPISNRIAVAADKMKVAA